MLTSLCDEKTSSLRTSRYRKTYAIKGIVKALRESYGRPIGGEGKGEFAITMHPATSYEDFIEGLRPDGEGSFTYQLGVFTQIVRKAIQEPDKDHVVLLDELNRSNVPRVMGDLLTTLEASKRTKQRIAKEHESLTNGQQTFDYVTFSEQERKKDPRQTGYRHTVSNALKISSKMMRDSFAITETNLTKSMILQRLKMLILPVPRKRNLLAISVLRTSGWMMLHPVLPSLSSDKILYPILGMRMGNPLS